MTSCKNVEPKNLSILDFKWGSTQEEFLEFAKKNNLVNTNHSGGLTTYKYYYFKPEKLMIENQQFKELEVWFGPSGINHEYVLTNLLIYFRTPGEMNLFKNNLIS